MQFGLRSMHVDDIKNEQHIEEDIILKHEDSLACYVIIARMLTCFVCKTLRSPLFKSEGSKLADWVRLNQSPP